jgi:hypothetical protein
MKRKELERKLRRMGWWYLRRGRRHDVWTNGRMEVQIPRHKEINEYTAVAILKKAEGGE